MSVWTARLKKWWWAVALFGVAAILVLLRVLFGHADDTAQAAAKTVDQTREKVRDADTNILIEKQKALADTAAKKGGLEEVQKIPDGRVRRQRLAELLGTELP